VEFLQIQQSGTCGGVDEIALLLSSFPVLIPPLTLLVWCASLAYAMAALPSLRTALRTLLPLPSSLLRRVHPPVRPLAPSRLLRPALPSLFASPLLRFQPSHLLQVRCSGSLKAKGKPRGPLWRQRKGVSKEALQVVFELKRCKADKQKERSVSLPYLISCLSHLPAFRYQT
jgi:hypothetical protein